MADFCFSTISASFMSFGWLYNDKHWLAFGQSSYPRTLETTINWLKKVVPGNYYSFIVADYQRARMEEWLKKFKIDQYIIFRSQYFGNKGHPSNGNHLQMIVIHFPQEYKYEE